VSGGVAGVGVGTEGLLGGLSEGNLSGAGESAVRRSCGSGN
jgi:hypothetical protein